jgi:hypothetical protein
MKLSLPLSLLVLGLATPVLGQSRSYSTTTYTVTTVTTRTTYSYSRPPCRQPTSYSYNDESSYRCRESSPTYYSVPCETPRRQCSERAPVRSVVYVYVPREVPRERGCPPRYSYYGR